MEHEQSRDAVPGDVFQGLLDGPVPDANVWEFNRLGVAALTGVALLVISTVVGAALDGWLPYLAVLSATLALPPLVLYLILESDRRAVPLDALHGPLAVGQTLSLNALVLFVASYSRLAAVLLVVTGALSIWWMFRVFIPRTGAAWETHPIMNDPSLHRTRMERLLWAIPAAARELGLKYEDIQPATDLSPADFDGHSLNRVQFPSLEVAEQFQAALRRVLAEAARTTQRAQ
jgi:hypothetical protein